MNTLLANLTPQQLRRAADVREKIDALQDELSRVLGSPAEAGDGAVPGKKRRMSRASRARIAAAARARWAAIKRAKAPAKSVRKPKRKISAAGRAALSLAAKARWRIARAKGKTTL
jgi:hypothetical protein